VFALLLVAVSLGLSNFAASVGIGAAGAKAGSRLRAGLVFGCFEAGMPVVGVLLGRGAAHSLGAAGHWAGGALLTAAGVYALVHALGERPAPPAGAGGAGPGSRAGDGHGGGAGGEHGGRAGGERRGRAAGPASIGRGWRLVVTGAVLSLDNLAVGFALGAFQVNLAIAAVTIGVVSALLSVAGLELGGRLGAATGRWGGFAGGLILAGTGVAILAGAL
jgi:manganese efflux pump family protein